jgi:tryptophanyl-tRNA synthetase
MSLPIALTGDRPTGPLHLGHYVGSLHTRLSMQHTHQLFILIADMQAMTDHFETPDKVHQAVVGIMQDYWAVGLDPEKCTFFIQSAVPELAELSLFFMNVVSMGYLERNPTVKAEIRQKGFGDQLPVGFFCYPVSQAADILAFGDLESKHVHVPVGDDQLPMIELTNHIARRFNSIYGTGETDILCSAQAHVGQTGRLMGIDGKHKASKSLNNAIFLSDDASTVRQKVFEMFTDPNHIRISDPGQVEGNVVFDYLTAFHQDTQELEALKAHYTQGGLGDTTLKNLLYTDLEVLLEPMRQRRAQLSTDQAWSILYKGTQRARAQAQKTLARVKKAMKLDYSSLWNAN